MSTDDAVIQFKTSAWQHAGQVSWYAGKMHENRGTNRLKNLVEISHIRENIAGTRILDVGIGTGRGSLPLARDGYSVTGVDASQAMLDQCRREAGTTPIELFPSDLTKLPFPDSSFDSAISLNVVSHFPNWRDALADWTRVVKPGGRIVFDVHSLDHMLAVAAARNCATEALLTPEQRSKPEHYFLRIGARDVAEAANALGLCVVALIPYGAILGGGNLNYWLLDSLLWGDYGDRALSWMALDEKLFEFGAFVEQRIAARLSTHATPRFMAVLEKREDAEQTERVVNYHKGIGAAFSGTPSMSALAPLAGVALNEWTSALPALLEHEPNRVLFQMMLSSPTARRLRVLLEDVLGLERAREAYDANEQLRIDTSVHEFVRSWHKDLVDPKHLKYKGVDLGPSLEYDAMRAVLESEFFKAEAIL